MRLQNVICDVKNHYFIFILRWCSIFKNKSTLEEVKEREGMVFVYAGQFSIISFTNSNFNYFLKKKNISIIFRVLEFGYLIIFMTIPKTYNFELNWPHTNTNSLSAKQSDSCKVLIV